MCLPLCRHTHLGELQAEKGSRRKNSYHGHTEVGAETQSFFSVC